MSFQTDCEEYEIYGNPEQDHIDFTIGAGSEFQNAFAQSSHENSVAASDSLAEINKRVAAGRFVVCAEYLTFCRHTDAITGSRKYAIQDFPSREEADTFAAAHNAGIEEGDYDSQPYFVLSAIATKVNLEIEDDDGIREEFALIDGAVVTQQRTSRRSREVGNGWW